MADISVHHSDYRKGSLDDLAPGTDPIELLGRWLREARESGTTEPEAMCLSTVDQDHRPSSRFVLLRGISPHGLTFFTNYESRKGRELETNPYACVAFWWGGLERQVRVEGRVERVSEDESDAYFGSRPAESRIASAASLQSQPIESRAVLERALDAIEAEFGGEVPRPDHWGGYRLNPDRIEFWQGRPARLHDRLEFRRDQETWTIRRLAP